MLEKLTQENEKLRMELEVAELEEWEMGDSLYASLHAQALPATSNMPSARFQEVKQCSQELNQQEIKQQSEKQQRGAEIKPLDQMQVDLAFQEQLNRNQELLLAIKDSNVLICKRLLDKCQKKAKLANPNATDPK